MTTITQILDEESLSRLAALRGGVWQYLGGVQVSNWMTDVSLFIATDSRLLTITGETTELDFEGEDDTYARFRIVDGATDLDAASRSGHLYYFNSGQTVQDVLIVRETVTEHREGQATWSYVTDIGIVFVLSGGLIAIGKVGHHTELLCVTRAQNLDALKLDDPSHGWEDHLDVEYSIERQTLAIDSLRRTGRPGAIG
jgi:hypothetical protein